MTNEELLNELIRHKKEMLNDFGWNITLQEALDMASEALEAQPCEDCVSREAVLTCEKHIWDDCGVVSVEDIKALPPVTPKQRTGKWIYDRKSNVYRCSYCNRFPWRVKTEPHDEIFEDLERVNAYKFCPHCGVKMEGESE